MEKQTAVEWLIDEMNNIKGSSISMNGSVQFIEKELNKLFEQAKAMEKEQMNKCYHPLTERKHTSDIHFECTICGYNNY